MFNTFYYYIYNNYITLLYNLYYYNIYYINFIKSILLYLLFNFLFKYTLQNIFKCDNISVIKI